MTLRVCSDHSRAASAAATGGEQGQAFVTNFSGSAWNAFGQSGQQK